MSHIRFPQNTPTLRYLAILIIACVLLAGNSCFIAAVCAARTAHVIRGQVLSSAGPVAGVTITMKLEGNSFSWSVQTAADGTYDFGQQLIGVDTAVPVVAPAVATGGDITLTATKDGFTFLPPTVKLTNVQSDKYVNFAAAQQSNPAPIVQIVRGTAEVLVDPTTKHRYGKILDKYYYATNVDIFNKLADLRNGTLIGDAIIISGASLRVPVIYETRYVGKVPQAKPERREWHPRDLELLSDPDVTKSLNLTKWQDYQAERNSVIQHKGGDSRCRQKPEYVRPYRYEQMTGTVDRREAKDWRSRALVAAESAATLTSFVTSFIVPVNTNDVPTILDKFKNLLIPSFKELYPSLKDENRKNLMEDIMKPLESVAFKDHIEKTVFLPKGTWKDADWETRISRVCADPIEIEAVVAKAGDQLAIQTVAGVVTDEDNTPIANATVTLNGAGFTSSAVTSSSGQFIFHNLPPGQVTLTVNEQTNCKRVLTETATIPPIGAAATTLALKIPSRFKLSGVIKQNTAGAAAGAPPVAAQLATVDLVSDAGVVIESKLTKADGTYEFACQLKATYTINASLGALRGTLTIPKASFTSTVADIVIR